MLPNLTIVLRWKLVGERPVAALAVVAPTGISLRFLGYAPYFAITFRRDHPRELRTAVAAEVAYGLAIDLLARCGNTGSIWSG